MKNIKLYYWNVQPNMGDMYNELLCNKLMGITPTHTSPDRCEAAFCGSLLDDFLYLQILPIRNVKIQNEEKVQIWGSGFIGNKWVCASRKRKLLPEVYYRNVDVHAVRGEKSRNRLQKILKRSMDEVVLADPGLLASMFVNQNIEKEYEVGIIPHHSEKELPVYKQFNFKKQIVIDVCDDPFACIKQIAKCKCIISSSLHGLIFADSFGIPNARLIASNGLKGGDYKFEDYYSSFRQGNRITIDVRKDISQVDLKRIVRDYSVDRNEVEEKKKQLLDCFPYERN